jgi:hypothetical protein
MTETVTGGSNRNYLVDAIQSSPDRSRVEFKVFPQKSVFR